MTTQSENAPITELTDIPPEVKAHILKLERALDFYTQGNQFALCEYGFIEFNQKEMLPFGYTAKRALGREPNIGERNHIGQLNEVQRLALQLHQIIEEERIKHAS